ncbi:GNAT family N-acetyltransferase [Alicyclobacillus suci]|uniref:GNAT family N-acetyltransferase n=1 Tax=Alicyclobacillus suci TaxID=2816080 RepID=UPI001A8EA984|nr:GNAT family N-acetyltransferase [Alicyclobacillus suci]
MTVLQTERLILRRWTENDVAAMAAINADDEVMRWIGKGVPATVDETREAIARWESGWEERGYGLFAVEVRETKQLAGFVGLSVPTFLPEVLPAVEIGWRLGLPFWGLGIATEAAKEVLRFGFQDCNLDEIISICQVGNHASERVMQKIGMRFERETIDPSAQRPVRVYVVGGVKTAE